MAADLNTNSLSLLTWRVNGRWVLVIELKIGTQVYTRGFTNERFFIFYLRRQCSRMLNMGVINE